MELLHPAYEKGMSSFTNGDSIAVQEKIVLDGSGIHTDRVVGECLVLDAGTALSGH